jgi:hypothetical protein
LRSEKIAMQFEMAFLCYDRPRDDLAVTCGVISAATWRGMAKPVRDRCRAYGICKVGCAGQGGCYCNDAAVRAAMPASGLSPGLSTVDFTHSLLLPGDGGSDRANQKKVIVTAGTMISLLPARLVREIRK